MAPKIKERLSDNSEWPFCPFLESGDPDPFTTGVVPTLQATDADPL